MLKCTKCKETKELKEFSKDIYRRTEKKAQCKVCCMIYNIEYKEVNKEKNRNKSREYLKTPIGKYNAIKTRCKRSEKQFLLTFKQYVNVTKTNLCFYCSENLPEYGSGIDRIDSNKGYVQDNCRPCCTMCNRMKSDYTESEFLSQMKKILKNVAIK
jgi:hypothetical protein